MIQNLDQHLKKYIIDTESRPYTTRDHSVWRFILRQLKSYLAEHAHPFYVEGLSKTGITIEEIPRIQEISEKLRQFGWSARPVSGFIPPAVFMEMQAAHILPIARDMRSIDQLQYTPAPDIVHEAAGHAPMLAHPEYAEYLRNYAQVAKKAIVSRQDLEIYSAIRKLSDLKSESSASQEEINKSQKHLEEISKNVTFLSEATLLSRMNWWTAEYGLIGTLENPKILGAGLLSSVGEAKWCLSDRVKKIPLSLDCINYSYDITEPQPQLFVTPDFKHLTTVLNELSSQMAYQVGGAPALAKAKQAETVCTVEINSGLQISGQIVNFIENSLGQVIFIKTQGPTQLSYQNQELHGHSKTYHNSGYSSPIGSFKKYPNQCPSTLTKEQWSSLGVQYVPGAPVTLEWESGFKLTGKFKSHLNQDNKNLLLTLTDAELSRFDQIYFQRAWGDFDLALGSRIPSVFGGPADRISYGETDEFNIATIPAPHYSDLDRKIFLTYQSLREIRNQKKSVENISEIFETALRETPNEWLIFIEILELSQVHGLTDIQQRSLKHLRAHSFPQEVKATIEDGIALSNRMAI